MAATATLLVRTSTTGHALDPDGYLLAVVGASDVVTRAIGTIGSADLTLPLGSYAIGLSGLSPNCAVAEADQAVTLSENGGADSARFMVGCGPAFGVLRVGLTVITARAVGPRRVVLDELEAVTVSGPDTVEFVGLADGVHVLKVLNGTFVGPLICGLFDESRGGADDVIAVPVIGGDTARVTLSYDCL